MQKALPPVSGNEAPNNDGRENAGMTRLIILDEVQQRLC